MPRDYAHRSRSRKSSVSRGMPWKIIITIIVLVTLLVFGLAFIRHHYVIGKQILPIKGGAPVEQAMPSKNLPVQPKSASEQTSVKFDFYNILPKMTVSTTNDMPTMVDNSRYILQLGSFNTEQAAQIFQQEAQQKGFRTFISTTSSGGQTWYRIQMGPYKNQDMAETERNYLEDAKIASILVPVSEDRGQRTEDGNGRRDY